MRPANYRNHFISAVVRRSGICRATVEQVLPAVFDEIRCQLSEGARCVPIESFGTFAVVDIPERTRRYTYKGADEVRTLEPTQRLKFLPTKNMRREVTEGRFDPSRQSFHRHPDDPAIRTRKHLAYNKRSQVFISQVPKSRRAADAQSQESDDE